MNGIAVIPIKDSCTTFTGKLNQFFKLYENFASLSDNDEGSVLSNSLYAFCWSFGGDIQEKQEVQQFDAAVRKALKGDENLQKVEILENVSIFQQKFDPGRKIWVDQGSALVAVLEVMNLLAENFEPILLVGSLESRFVLKAFESKWSSTLGEEGLVVHLNPGSQVKKRDCLARVLDKVRPLSYGGT